MLKALLRPVIWPLVFFWRSFFGTIRQMRESDIHLLASSLAFGTVLSLVPLLAVTLSVFKAYGGFDILQAQIEPFILQNFVDVSGAQVSNLIRRAIGRIHSGTLGTGGAIALLLVSTKLFHDMDTAVQRVWGIKTNRSLFRRLPIYWVVMFLGPLVLAVFLGVMGSRGFGVIKMLPKGFAGPCLAFLVFVFIYKWMPAIKVKWKSAIFGAMIAAVSVGIAQATYAQLTKGILRYSKIYGSLASIPIFLLWVLIMWWIFLGGVALTAAIQLPPRSSKSSSPARKSD